MVLVRQAPSWHQSQPICFVWHWYVGLDLSNPIFLEGTYVFGFVLHTHLLLKLHCLGIRGDLLTWLEYISRLSVSNG